MTPLVFAVPQAGRADTVLAAGVEGLTRSAAQRWLEEGRVELDGHPVRKNTRLEPGQTLRIVPPPPRPSEVEAQNIPLDVVYEDEHLLVVNKPVGMVVHPAPGHATGTLVNALLFHCGPSLSGINGVLRPGIVHRIDRDTSGLLVVAKYDTAHQSLAAQLQDHSLFRLYHAVTVGEFRAASGTIDAPLNRHPVDRKRMAVCPAGQGRAAVTHWQVVDSGRGHAHIICRLETGRTHQIRAHMSHISHPLLGDPVYGRPAPGLAGQCLHAARLTFTHPATGERMTVEAPLPDWFRSTLHRLGLSEH